MHRPLFATICSAMSTTAFASPTVTSGRSAGYPRVHRPLLEPLKRKAADLRPNRLWLQSSEHHEVVGVAERDSCPYEGGLERLLSPLLRMETRQVRGKLDVGQEKPGRGEVVLGEL